MLLQSQNRANRWTRDRLRIASRSSNPGVAKKRHAGITQTPKKTMKIIVLARANDNHTAAVKWALEQGGYEVACWSGVSWVEQQHASMLLDDPAQMMLGPDPVDPGDTVWIRRPERPILNPSMSEADRKLVEAQYYSFYNCIAYGLETLSIRCVNKFSAAHFIDNKAVQLRLAQASGLKVPRTLMANSPAAVANFLAHSPNRTIYKAFTPHIWQRQSMGGVAITETFEMTHAPLPEAEVLTYAPGIYQEMVVKEFDVRMVLMGQEVYSFALHNPKKALDWRGDASVGRVAVEIIPTPPEVESGILAFARKAGVCFGSIDFAVDMNGQWWFLEINEEGQFLWLDQKNHAAGTQQKFCAFLTSPEGSTQKLEERAGLFPSFTEYEQSIEKGPVEDSAEALPVSPHFSLEP